MNLPQSCMRKPKPCATPIVSLNQVPRQGTNRGKWRILYWRQLWVHALNWTTQTHWKVLLFPCMDWMVGELDQRFCSVDAGLLKGIQACSPKSENFEWTALEWTCKALQSWPENRGGSSGQKLLPGKQRLDVHPKMCRLCTTFRHVSLWRQPSKLS